jgi:hypothetical protein
LQNPPHPKVLRLLAVPFRILERGQDKRAEVARRLAESPGLAHAKVARLCGVCRATVTRVVRAMRKKAKGAGGRRSCDRPAVAPGSRLPHPSTKASAVLPGTRWAVGIDFGSDAPRPSAALGLAGTPPPTRPAPLSRPSSPSGGGRPWPWPLLPCRSRCPSSATCLSSRPASFPSHSTVPIIAKCLHLPAIECDATCLSVPVRRTASLVARTPPPTWYIRVHADSCVDFRPFTTCRSPEARRSQPPPGRTRN